MVRKLKSMKTKEQWVEELDLLPHPEGGFYKETYRAEDQLDLNFIYPSSYGLRSLSTGIYFLLDKANFSAFHRIKSDEMWHFYDGDPLLVHMIDQNGTYSKQAMGRDLANGEKLQFVVKAGVWFASEVKSGGNYSLVGCTVSFGFDFQDFELANKQLIETYPQHAEILSRLIREH